MADNTYHFRSALGGFHKGDVTGYIEKMAAQHRSELLEYEKTINDLREENLSLQQQLNLLMMSTTLTTEPASSPLSEPVDEPEPESEPTPETESVPETESETESEAAPESEAVSAPAEAEDTDLMSLELKAYRRAEAVERNANNRARKLYAQMEDLCEDALDEFKTTDSAVKQTIEAILAQANSLEQSYQALAAALNASREKLNSMNELFSVPDDMPEDE